MGLLAANDSASSTSSKKRWDRVVQIRNVVMLTPETALVFVGVDTTPPSLPRGVQASRADHPEIRGTGQVRVLDIASANSRTLVETGVFDVVVDSTRQQAIALVEAGGNAITSKRIRLVDGGLVTDESAFAFQPGGPWSQVATSLTSKGMIVAELGHSELDGSPANDSWSIAAGLESLHASTAAVPISCPVRQVWWVKESRRVIVQFAQGCLGPLLHSRWSLDPSNSRAMPVVPRDPQGKVVAGPEWTASCSAGRTGTTIFRHPCGTWMVCDVDGANARPLTFRSPAFPCSPAAELLGGIWSSVDGRLLMRLAANRAMTPAQPDGQWWFVDPAKAEARLVPGFPSRLGPDCQVLPLARGVLVTSNSAREAWYASPDAATARLVASWPGSAETYVGARLPLMLYRPVSSTWQTSAELRVLEPELDAESAVASFPQLLGMGGWIAGRADRAIVLLPSGMSGDRALFRPGVVEMGLFPPHVEPFPEAAIPASSGGWRALFLDEEDCLLWSSSAIWKVHLARRTAEVLFPAR